VVPDYASFEKEWNARRSFISRKIFYSVFREDFFVQNVRECKAYVWLVKCFIRKCYVDEYKRMGQDLGLG
jgi:hypothetical protein